MELVVIRILHGKEGLDYNEYSLFRELMERVWSPQNLYKNINDL